MSAGLLVAVLAGVAALAWVLAPLLRADAALAERVGRAAGEIEDLHDQREMALAALRDLEEDRSTGKISDRDYQDFKARLSTRAVDVLKRLEAAEQAAAAVRADRTGPHAVPRTEG